MKEWESGNYFHILNVAVYVVKITRTQEVKNLKVMTETMANYDRTAHVSQTQKI